MQLTHFTLLSALSAGALAGTSGCGKTPPFDAGHHHQLTVNSPNGGGNRSYILALPSTYDSSKPVPLILSFHGNGKNATNQLYLSEFVNEDWNPHAISVYPQGENGRWTGAPYGLDTNPPPPNDLVFTSDLLDALADSLCLDVTRVYCNGKSLGGGFCNVLACDDDLSKHFAAIAPVSGAFYTTPANASFSSECHPHHLPLPVLEFHGLKDMTIKYTGGEHNGVDLRNISDWAQQWANEDGCKGAQPVEIDTHNNTVHRYSWTCNAKAGIVQHFAIEGLGHTWPSTSWNPDNEGKSFAPIDATPIIMSFFNNYTLPNAPALGSQKAKTAVAAYKRSHARAF